MQQFVLQPEAGEAPNVLVGVFIPHFAQEGQEVALVLRLKGLAAQHRQAADEGLVQLSEDLGLRLVGEFPAIAEIPGLGLEAVGAVVGAAGYEQRDADACSVGNIVFFQLSVIHGKTS